MRLLLSLALITAALIAKVEATYAEAAESYPWCGISGVYGGGGGSRSCYYTSREQCLATILGIGGMCVPSPYYRSRSEPPPVSAEKRRRQHY